MKELWTTEITEYHGEYIDFPPLVCAPKPVQRPHPPIFVGGELEAAARRIANYGDGWLPEPGIPLNMRTRINYRARGST